MIKNIIKEMTIEEKVGQMCVAMLQSDHVTEEIKTQIEKYHVGVIRYCPDAEFDNASVVVGEPNKYLKPNETAHFLNELQKMSKLPLIISVDQEGGCRADINRCNAMVYSSHMCFGVADDENLTYEVTRATAKEFRAMGINQIQSPICDVFRYSGRQTMKAATFGDNPESVKKHAIAMKRGFNDGGVISMGKHFPGYGSIATDAHKGTAYVEKSLDELINEDIVPFKGIVDDGVQAIMSGHVVVDAIDKEYPATLSETVLQGFLRENLGFDGVIMTDAMRMHAIQDNYSTGEGSVLAVLAGCDLILLRGDINHFEEGYNAILEAVKSGRIAEEILDKAIERVLKVKEQFGLFENRFADEEEAVKIVGCKEHQELLRRLADKSVSVLKKGVLPLSDDCGKIAVITCEPQKIKAAMDKKQCVEMLEKEIKAQHENTEGIIVKLSPDEVDIKNAVEFAKRGDVIVLGMCSAIIFGEQLTLYRELQKLGKKIIVIAMESPCDIELVPDCDGFVATYGVARDWMAVASEHIFGKAKINAKPAIEINC